MTNLTNGARPIFPIDLFHLQLPLMFDRLASLDERFDEEIGKAPCSSIINFAGPILQTDRFSFT